MVRQWQQLFFDRRYASTELVNPDFVTIAKGYHMEAARVTKREDLKAAVQAMLSSSSAYFWRYVLKKKTWYFL